MAKAGTPAQPSPTSHERTTQPSSTATTYVMGTRREQIPESFLRQSVPIKVRVTVGELKQNQELQRSIGGRGGRKVRRLGRGLRTPKGQTPTTSHACSAPTWYIKETWSCLHPHHCVLYPTSQGGLSHEPQLFLLFHRFKAKVGAVLPWVPPVYLLSSSPMTPSPQEAAVCIFGIHV